MIERYSPFTNLERGTSVSTTDKVAVIKARLPYIDRRALSEAWYSALHVAENVNVRVPARRAGDPGNELRAAESPCTASECGTSPCAARAWSGPERRIQRPAVPSGGAPPAARRLGLTRTAAFQRARSYPPFKATLTLGLDGARVAVLLRRDGPALRVVAICSAQHLDVVRRALACADRHLRARGELVLSDVRVAECEADG